MSTIALMARAVVGAVVAAVVQDPMVDVSGGSEHQGPAVGGPVAIAATDAIDDFRLNATLFVRATCTCRYRIRRVLLRSVRPNHSEPARRRNRPFSAALSPRAEAAHR